MIIMVFLKLITRPFPSVIRPSSSTWSKRLNTSGCAFSTSSKRMTEYGRWRTASVNCPDSSYPTYPGAVPVNLEIECFSINSDMSTRINAFSSSNMNSVSALVSSVFPTPVGPRNMNDPIGRFGSEIPTRERRIAFEIFSMASPCPFTRFLSSTSMFWRRSVSPCNIFITGILVHFATTRAISSSVTSSRNKRS